MSHWALYWDHLVLSALYPLLFWGYYLFSLGHNCCWSKFSVSVVTGVDPQPMANWSISLGYFLTRVHNMKWDSFPTMLLTMGQREQSQLIERGREKQKQKTGSLVPGSSSPLGLAASLLLSIYVNHTYPFLTKLIQIGFLSLAVRTLLNTTLQVYINF